MRKIRLPWLNALIAVVASVALLIASTEVALANNPIADAPTAWHEADAGLPPPVSLAILDAQPAAAPGALAPEPDVPEVIAAPIEGGMTKGLLVLLGLVFVVTLLAVTLGVLFLLDLTTDFDLFPNR